MIRCAQAHDAEQLAGIYRPYVEETCITFEETAPTTAEMGTRIGKVSATYPWLVIDESTSGSDTGEILGYAYASRYRERAAYRWSLETSVYIRRDARGRGLGAALYGALIPLLKELGIRTLYGAITLPNAPSLALHARFGFRPLCTYERVGFKMGAWRDVGWTMLRLRGSEEEGPASSPPDEPTAFPEFARTRPDELTRLLDRSPRSRA